MNSSEAMRQSTSNLGDNWVTLIPADPERVDPTDEDLDAVVREYGSRDDKGKAPVYVGKASQTGAQPIGRVDALRRRGGGLEARFSGVDPRVEYLHGRGAFHKKSVLLNRSMNGVSLGAVGLVHREYLRGALHNDQTPSLDELMKQFTGANESTFGETLMNSPDFSNGWTEFTSDVPELREQFAQNAVASLKNRGRWCDRYDRAGLPLIFAEAAGTPALGPLVHLVASLVDTADPQGELLTECARYFAREYSMTFGEALNMVAIPQTAPSIYGLSARAPGSTVISSRQREQERMEGQAAIDEGLLPEELVGLAWKRAKAEGWPFNYALKVVQGENPGVMQRFQMKRRHARSAS